MTIYRDYALMNTYFFIARCGVAYGRNVQRNVVTYFPIRKLKHYKETQSPQYWGRFYRDREVSFERTDPRLCYRYDKYIGGKKQQSKEVFVCYSEEEASKIIASIRRQNPHITYVESFPWNRRVIGATVASENSGGG